MPLLADASLVIVDTETTGFSPREGHALVDLATLAMVAGEPVAEWSSLVRPGRPIPPDAAALHGITDAMVAEAPEPDRIAGELRGRLGDGLLVFHNAAFDLSFLVPLFRRHGLAALGNPVLDTLGLARGLQGHADHSLSALAAHYGLPAAPHRARDDVRVTAGLLPVLVERWERERGVSSLMELAAVSQDVLRASRLTPSVAVQ